MDGAVTGSLADAADAQRAAWATITPWWQRVLFGAAGAALLAASMLIFFKHWPAGGAAAVTRVIILVLAIWLFLAYRLSQRHRGVGKRRRRRRFSGRFLVIYIAAEGLGGAAMLIGAWWLPGGNFQAFAFLFGLFFVLLTVLLYIVEKVEVHIHTRAARRTTGAGRFDELIAPTTRLMVSAVLAVVPMTLDRLARTLSTPESELTKHITELAGADYVHTSDVGKDPVRQWISLSDAGYAAYTGHVQALRARRIPELTG